MNIEKDIIFLFGAGASYGSGGIIPETPPLGFHLYEILEEIYPGSWGALPDNYRQEFKNDFEIGMGLVYKNYGALIPQLMRELAIYFIQFRPHNGRSLYSKLIQALNDKNKLEKVILSTLNYECVLEYSVISFGSSIDYFQKSKDTIPIWKLHGSCNMFSQGVQASQDIAYGTGVVFEGGIQAFLDSNKVIEECLVKTGLAPVMCLFMEGKPLQVSPSSIKQLQKSWAKEVENAKAIFCIGINPLPADSHIWDPLSTTSADLYYIGDQKRFETWVSNYRKEHHSEIISQYFHTGFNKLLTKIEHL